MTGDTRLLEKIVAYGAAIDLPVKELYPVPVGVTLILLSCAQIAMTKIMSRPLRNESSIEGCLKCTMQVVRPRANCDVRSHLFRQYGLNGKSSRDRKSGTNSAHG